MMISEWLNAEEKELTPVNPTPEKEMPVDMVDKDIDRLLDGLQAS